MAGDFTLHNRTLVLDKEDADGMALDEEGKLWVTGFRSSHVVRLTPGGGVMDLFEFGKGSITQLRFGGRDMRDIFSNSVPADGGEITAKRSLLYRTRSQVRGMRLEPAAFTIR